MNMINEAIQLVEDNQIEKAIALLESYLPLADTEDKYSIAELYIQWGFLEEAKVILIDLLQLYPDESELKLSLSEIYTELEDDEAAINLLNEIKRDDPSYIQSLIQLADLYQVQGLYEVAEQKLLIAKQIEPNEPIIDFALAELLFSIGDYFKAITYYERIERKTNEVATVNIKERLAEAYASIGEYEKALTYYKDIHNENPDTLFKYGLTAYQSGRNDIAIKAWEQVIKLDAGYQSVYYYIANAYEEEEMPKEAYVNAKKGLNVDEFNKELYFYAGSLARQLNKNDESEKWVRGAIALDPEYKEAIIFLTELFKENNNHLAIIDLLQEIKTTGATDPIYDWELARSFNEIESYNNALKCYQEAYNSLNHDSDFLKEYGYFLTEEGRIKDAIPIFEAYIKEQPLDNDVWEYLERLQQTKNNY